MDSSRRAVVYYWRSRLIRAVTSDEDKLLQFWHASIVNEVSEYILKRLKHKSPVVKEKALRLIKYVVVRPGMEFHREMQQNSVEVCQLLHYQGQLDLGGGIQGYKTRKQLMGNFGKLPSSYSEAKAHEERLLETTVTFGGGHLQPTRDAVQAFPYGGCNA